MPLHLLLHLSNINYIYRGLCDLDFDIDDSYIDELVEEYKDILNSDALSSDKYWALRKKIYDDYKSPGVLARDVSRSNMLWILLGLLRDEAITMDDLDEFSDELKEDIAQFIN